MCENKKGDKCAINNGECIGEFECERAKLLDEILELKKEVETRDNLSETYRKEALSWANIAKEYQKDNKHLNDLLDNVLKEQEELREEIKQLHNGRNPEELYTLFGKPIKYWEELKVENERLKEENEKLNKMTGIFSVRLCEKYLTTLQEIKKIAERNIFLSPKLLEINGDIGQIQNIAITQILDLITKAEEE